MIAPKPGAGYHVRSVVAITERNSLGWPGGRQVRAERHSVLENHRVQASRMASISAIPVHPV